MLPKIMNKLIEYVYPMANIQAEVPEITDLYDFPLLKTLPSKTLCAESCVGIKENFKGREWKAPKQNDSISKSKKILNFTNISISRASSYYLINLNKHLLGCYTTQS